jgi:hypothetical protein
MDLNALIFPAPDHELSKVEYFEGELIFIPKDKNISNINLEKYSFIPCILLLSKMKTIAKNFCIYFHGNAEDIFLARDVADKIRNNLYMNVLLVEYPGYSIYSEEKSSDQVLQDSLTVFDFLKETLKISEDNIYVFGRSIGCSPGLYLCGQRKPAGLIMMSPFTSIRAVAENLVGNVLKFLVGERFQNIEYIKDVSCPILFIHGQLDTLVPFEQTIQLKNNCMCPYEVVLPEDMTHNEFDYELDLIFPLKDFLRRHTEFKIGEPSELILPLFLFEIPMSVRFNINRYKNAKNRTGISCFNSQANEMKEEESTNASSTSVENMRMRFVSPENKSDLKRSNKI